MVSWQALFAPAGTPAAIVDRLHAEVLKVVATPEVQEKLKGFGMEPSTMTPACMPPGGWLSELIRLMKWYGGAGSRGTRRVGGSVAYSGPKAATGLPVAHASSDAWP